MPDPYYAADGVALYLGDNLDVLPGLPASSVHAIVTDPPYGLEFMGSDWDAPWRGGINADAGFTQTGFTDGAERLPRPSYTGSTNPVCRNCKGRKRGRRDGTAVWKTCTCADPDFPNVRATEMQAFQEWCERWARECLRILKPGGHLLAFGGTRTAHRLTGGIEDAGFEIRDAITWMYASGFPKSLNVARAIDLRAGIDPETASPATPEAVTWAGWGTALKPASEPIVVARKPLTGPVAVNVLEHGTGALNITACRVGSESRTNNAGGSSSLQRVTRVEQGYRPNVTTSEGPSEVDGRWPSNVVFTHAPGCQPVGPRRIRTSDPRKADGTVNAQFGGNGIYGGASGKKEPRCYADADGMEVVEAWDCVPGCPVAELDAQSGISVSRPFDWKTHHSQRRNTLNSANDGSMEHPQEVTRGHSDSGGASRFFPVFPAPADDCPDCAAEDGDDEGFPAFRFQAKASAAERPRGADGRGHPTVKPLELMRWLVRLVCPPDGTVLDPFAGSGTTGEACIIEGFGCILVERDPDFAELAAGRLRKPVQPVLLF